MNAVYGHSPAYHHKATQYQARAQYQAPPQFGGFVQMPDGSIYEQDDAPKKSWFSVSSLLKLGAVAVAGFVGVKYGLPALRTTSAYKSLGLDKLGNFLSGLASTLKLDALATSATSFLSRLKFW